MEGEGKFRKQSDITSTTHKGLILAKAQRNTGSEIFPDEMQVLSDSADLEEYIFYLDESYSGYESRRFNEKDPVFDQQIKKLETITKEQCEELYEMFCQGTIEKHLQNETIQKLMERLIKLKEG